MGIESGFSFEGNNVVCGCIGREFQETILAKDRKHCAMRNFTDSLYHVTYNFIEHSQSLSWSRNSSALTESERS